MKSMNNHKRFLLGVGVFLFLVSVSLFRAPRVHAQGSEQPTAAGNITLYSTNWGQNGTVVNTTAPFINPGNCTWTDAYQTDPSNPPVETSALLGALLGGKQVVLSIQGCADNRPMILGVQVNP